MCIVENEMHDNSDIRPEFKPATVIVTMLIVAFFTKEIYEVKLTGGTEYLVDITLNTVRKNKRACTPCILKSNGAKENTR